MKKWKRSLACLVAISLVGCANVPANTPRLVVECGSVARNPSAVGPALVGEDYGPKTTPIPLDSVLFASKDLSKRIAVQSIFAARSETHTVRLTARLINCSDSAAQVSVRAHFMDRERRPTEKPSGWQAVYLQPRGLGIYDESSIASEPVAHYLLEVRDPK